MSWFKGTAAGHNDFIRLVKEMATKLTDVTSTSACTGTGTGIVYGASSTPSSVAETWRLTCTDAGSFVIAGACSPNITGAYTKTGVNDGKPSFDNGTYACWWSTADEIWYNTIIANIGTPPTDAFRLDKPLAEGSWEAMGTSTGVPVSVGDSLPTFSVVGGETGTLANAVQERPYSENYISFTILKGTTFYEVDDYFDIVVGVTAPLWIVDRYTTGTNYELIMHGQGGETNAIYVGMQGVTDGSTYYNIKVAGFTGYVGGNTFDLQPGVSPLKYFCTAGTAFDFYIWMSARRVMGEVTIGSRQEGFYLGWIKPNATPSQVTYPLAVGGTTASSTQLIATAGNEHAMYWRLIATTINGTSVQGLTFFDDTFWTIHWDKDNWPITSTYYTNFARYSRDINGNYPLWPVKLRYIVNNKNYGDFEGLYGPAVNHNQITLLDVLTTYARAFVCFQNIDYTGDGHIVAIDLF